MSDTNRIAILGGSGAIGSEVATRLVDDGHTVALGARTESKLREVAEPLGAEAIPVDATDPDQVDTFFDRAVDSMGGLDGVINCVGSILLKPAHRTSDAEWDETRALNLDSAFYAVQKSARHMQREGGAIVLVTTAAAQIGLANHDAIAAAKAGVIGLTRASAASYARRGIRVNAVAPGMTETPMSAPILKSDQSRKMSEKMHPLGRLGQPEDIASAIVWLIDDEQSWVTGQILGVDGGLAQLKTQ